MSARRPNYRCDTCGAQPCILPSFCAACRLADRKLSVARRNGADVVPIRADLNLPVGFSSEHSAFLHLKGTFDFACTHHPDAMEPYVAMLVETDDLDAQQNIMTEALKATFSIRHHHIDGLPST